MTPPRPALPLGLVLLAGCATNLRHQVYETNELLVRARLDGAYLCAPRELAIGETHLEFTTLALDSGAVLQARHELAVASGAARRALAQARSKECLVLLAPLEKGATPAPVRSLEAQPVPLRVESATSPETAVALPAASPLAPAAPLDAPRPGATDAQFQLIHPLPDQIELRRRVHFSASQQIMPDSLPMLREVADALQARPETSVFVDGHTDARGSARRKIRLSRAEAEAVRAQLVDFGVEAGRIRARALGSTQPIADNRTAAGREANHRIEILLRGPSAMGSGR